MNIYLTSEHITMLNHIKESNGKKWKPSHLMQNAIEEEWKKTLSFFVSSCGTEVRVKTRSGFSVGFDLEKLNTETDGVITACDLSEWEGKGFEKVELAEAENLFNEHSDYGYEILEKHVFRPFV